MLNDYDRRVALTRQYVFIKEGMQREQAQFFGSTLRVESLFDFLAQAKIEGWPDAFVREQLFLYVTGHGGVETHDTTCTTLLCGTEKRER
jgi:hypothetical protein